jgi:tetratricopeptide (TPR) repeat protein
VIVDRCFVRTVAFLLVLVFARHAIADDASDAERLYNEGQAAYDGKRYDAAIAAWDKSYALSKLPALVFNLAQAHRLAGHCTQAVEHYQRFITLDPQAEDKPAAEQFVRELSPCPVAKPVERPTTEWQLVDKGAGKRRAGMIAAGAGLVVFATGIYFGSRASTIANEVEAACAMGCEWSELESKDAAGRRDAVLQYPLYAIGAAGIIGGVSLYILGKSKTRVMVEPRANGVAFRVTW